MVMKKVLFSLVVIGLLVLAGKAYSADDATMKMDPNMKMDMSAQSNATATSNAVNVGNKICPVTGEKIDGSMGPVVTYEYKGKIYNFCCNACPDEFKKDPDKYIKIVEKELSAEKGTSK
jgi:YHS domain-containing protein